MRPETAGFDKASHAYERGRPGYPADAVDFIVAEARVADGETLVDLAAGTGKLTRELVARGLHVVAVEPLEQMRTRLAELLPSVDALEGTAHATGLATASAAAVTVAQAFHWFSDEAALAEIARILRPRGRLLLCWNRRDLSDPVQAQISRLTAPFVKDAPSYGNGVWQQVMAATSHFAPVSEGHFRISQELDRDGLVDRVGSTSYIATLPDEVRLGLLEKIAALAPGRGAVRLPYDTDVYVYERT